MALLGAAIFLVAIWSLSTRSGCPIAAFGRSRYLARLWTRSGTFLAWFGRGGARGTGGVAILRAFAFLAQGLFGWSNSGGAAILLTHGCTRRSIAKLVANIVSEGFRWRNSLCRLDRADGRLHDVCTGDGLSGTIAAAA
jgi:hypothetical protein